MFSLYGILTFALALWYMEYIKRRPEKAKEEPLVDNERYIVPLLCVLNPVLGGLSFYFGWKNAFPKKAQQANHWSLGAFLGWLIVSLGVSYLENGTFL